MVEEVLMVAVLVVEWREEAGLVVGLLGLWLRWLALLRVVLTVCRKSTSCRVAASYVWRLCSAWSSDGWSVEVCHH